MTKLAIFRAILRNQRDYLDGLATRRRCGVTPQVAIRLEQVAAERLYLVNEVHALYGVVEGDRIFNRATKLGSKWFEYNQSLHGAAAQKGISK